MLSRFKQFLLVGLLSGLFGILSLIRNDSLFRRAYSAIAWLAERLVRKDYYIEKIRWIKGLFDEGHPSLQVTKKILRGTNPHHRRTIIRAFIINQLLVGTNKRKAFSEQNDGFYPPGFFVISPSMKCNLNCYGCYAGYYRKNAELRFEEIDRTLSEAKEMGIYFCVVSGGEPLFHPRIFDIFERHNDVIFHMYTNGSLIDEETCRRMARVGNVIPAISVEGFEKETDERRGKGHFARVMKAMDLLREARILFGFSATLTRQNTELLNSDRFVDFMIEKGCVLGWYFMYVPIGREPNLDIMPTPEQRGAQVERLARLRATKPIFLADFWNDGPVVGGCISGGRKYFHVNAMGDVEPCVFCHFATHNIRTSSLKEALRAPLFESIRCNLPVYENLLRPCVIIDRPEVGRNAIFEHGAYFTHDGAEIIYEGLAHEIDGYAKAYGKIADGLWEKYFRGNGR
ncbi:MAG: radical SAM protein [Deltaproteobacteria bacterium]|nr:radical SAM protein [Deltaproteobacteria bacterium]MBW1924828.1 radical SAM protein [Deltaproteobacteria bacterium]MBW1948509.1 radical SAM protein [Deltaproteobacteria bacterium]MBW2006674.1 radical SAM protein [Deltaproteobacteria bacterium]MBW2101212.1 radical SAM protein [Deltaproteobacteria bacterium]